MILIFMKVDGKEYMTEGALSIILQQLGWDYANMLTDITKKEHDIENDCVNIKWWNKELNEVWQMCEQIQKYLFNII